MVCLCFLVWQYQSLSDNYLVQIEVLYNLHAMFLVFLYKGTELG